MSFVKEVSMHCVDLRIDNLDWMMVADLRRLLSNFRSLICFHTGNVSLSKTTVVNDMKILFPFLKYITLLLSIDDLTTSLSSTGQTLVFISTFQEIWESLKEIDQLEYVSLVLQAKKGTI